MENLIGKKLDGRYQIDELIGMGGMANVYRATDLTDNRTVAVKVLRDEFLDNEELVRRFKNESKAIGLLSHPNIVKVYDVNFSDSIQYIVMEYIDGITLKQYIDVQHVLNWKDIVHFTTQILRALQHAHDRGIVHRDIKPQNIMLTADGSIKVMDFGIARFSRSETRTITDKAIGSVHYISPEQAKGDITDSKADIYSVGIMMYEMMTGTLPFESDTPVQVAIKQISDDARRPREIIEDLPEGLEEITMKAMAKDPNRRYQSASQMLRDIDDFKKNPSIVFNYKYFTEHGMTRTIDKIASTATGERAKKSADDTVDEPKKVAGTKRKPRRKSRITTYVIVGVTAAIFICTALLVLYALGLVDKQYASVKVPDFRGQRYEDVVNNSAYNFKFEYSDESSYNADYEVGEIYYQTPMPPKNVKGNSVVVLFVSKGIEEFEMPDVLDMSSGEAKRMLSNMGLQVRQESANDPNYAQNIVVGQEPVAGTTVTSGSEVVIRVNMLVETSRSKVPNVVGKSQVDALSDLNKAGLFKGSVTEQPDMAPKGTVLSQSVPPDSTVMMGTKVDLVVSSGPIERTYKISIDVPNAPATAVYNLSCYVGSELIAQDVVTGPIAGWGPSVTVRENNITISVYANSQLIAQFVAQSIEDKIENTLSVPVDFATYMTPHTVSASISGNGTVTEPVSAMYGVPVTFTVTPDPGFVIVGVTVASGDGTVSFTGNVVTVVVGTTNTAIVITMGPG